jgi:class 3 adenylate cyclase
MPANEVTESAANIVRCLRLGGDDLADIVEAMHEDGLTDAEIVARVVADPLRRNAVDAINHEFRKAAASLVCDVEDYLAAIGGNAR